MNSDAADEERLRLEPEGKRITSENLAALIVDALITAKLIDKKHTDFAIAIAEEEIDARKALGDY